MIGCARLGRVATLALNLAALTGEELQRLLGPDLAQKRLPDISRARMQGQVYAGPAVPAELTFTRLEAGAAWGATAADAQRLRALRDGLLGAGFAELGAVYLPDVLGARHALAFLGGADTRGTDTAASVRWSETPGPQSAPPHVQLLTSLRDRASGSSLVLTTTAVGAPSPAPSEEVAVRHLPGAAAAEAAEAHAREVLRHGRGLKLADLDDWARPWRALHALNRSAWMRRGVLLEQVP